jgi:transposase
MISQFTTLQSQADLLEKENKLLRELIRRFQLEKYGPRAEKLNDGQLTLLDAEPSVTAAEVAAEAELASAELKPAAPRNPKNQNHPGRIELPAHLPRREVIIPCPPHECVCGQCGQERPVIGYEVTEELDVEPAVYFVRQIKREKRGSHCLPEQGVATAPCPAKILPRSKLSNTFIVEALLQKYEEHKPIYRQCVSLERAAGVELSRETLTGSVLAAGALLQPVAEVLAKELRAGSYIQADETPVPCQSRSQQGKNHQAYLWEISRPGGPVVFYFRMSRGRAGPLEFLQGFSGVLQTDGYAAYDKLGAGIIHAACAAHVRRQFHRAHELAPKDPVPVEILKMFAELYAIEAQAREQNYSTDQKLEARQRESAPRLAALKKRILEIAQSATPGTQLGKACKYALGQWTRLEVFLTHPEIEIDSNWCENAIRPLALGRRNWLHIGSAEAGPKVAAIASIIETCHRLEINARQYLSHVLPRLPEWPVNRIAELTPASWQAARSTAK